MVVLAIMISFPKSRCHAFAVSQLTTKAREPDWFLNIPILVTLSRITQFATKLGRQSILKALEIRGPMPAQELYREGISAKIAWSSTTTVAMIHGVILGLGFIAPRN